MIEDTMFDNDCYAVFMEEEHEKEKRVRDNISRQAAIEWCLEGLNNMPSAEPKTGEWIPNHDGSWNCSECGLRVLVYAKGNYCPNCGARMVKEDGEA